MGLPASTQAAILHGATSIASTSVGIQGSSTTTQPDLPDRQTIHTKLVSDPGDFIPNVCADVQWAQDPLLAALGA